MCYRPVSTAPLKLLAVLVLVEQDWHPCGGGGGSWEAPLSSDHTCHHLTARWMDPLGSGQIQASAGAVQATGVWSWGKRQNVCKAGLENVWDGLGFNTCSSPVSPRRPAGRQPTSTCLAAGLSPHLHRSSQHALDAVCDSLQRVERITWFLENNRYALWRVWYSLILRGITSW